MIYRIVNLLFPFLTIFVFSSYISFDSLGVFFLCQSIALWLSLIVDFGFLRSGVKILNDNGVNISNSILFLQFFLGIICIPVSLLVFLVFDNIDAADLIYIYVYGVTLGLIPRWYFQSENLMFILTKIEFLVRSTSIVLLLFVCYLPNRYFVEFVYGLSSTFYVLICWFIVLKSRTEKVSFNWVEIKFLYNKSILTFISRVSGNVGLNANVIILSTLLPPNLVAIYGIGERIAKALSMLISSVSEAIFPNYEISNHKKMMLAIKYTSLLSFLSVSISYFLLPFILRYGISLDDRYHIIILIMVWSCVFYGLSSCISLVGLVSEGFFKHEMLSQIIFGVFSVAISYSMVKSFDLFGASLSYLINSILSMVIILAIYLRVKKAG